MPSGRRKRTNPNPQEWKPAGGTHPESTEVLKVEGEGQKEGGLARGREGLSWEGKILIQVGVDGLRCHLMDELDYKIMSRLFLAIITEARF